MLHATVSVRYEIMASGPSGKSCEYLLAGKPWDYTRDCDLGKSAHLYLPLKHHDGARNKIGEENFTDITKEVRWSDS